MKMNAAKVVRDRIEDAGIASAGYDLFEGYLPNKPANCVAVILTGGTEPNPKWRYEEPSVQVLIRGEVNSYLATYERIAQVRNLLLGIAAFDTSDGRVVGVTGIGDVIFMGYDDSSRPSFVMNFRVMQEPNTSDARDPLP